MKLFFDVPVGDTIEPIEVDFHQCIVAGWAGRDAAAIEHHIQELAELGVARPSAVPLYYRIAANQLTQNEKVQVVGDTTSGEAEVFLFSHNGQTMVSLASDHTDRKLETHSVALSKQLCAKPVARQAWRYDEVADHWDTLILRSRIEENGKTVTYQEGTLASLQPPLDLAQGFFGARAMPAGAGMTCGTVATQGSIRPAPWLELELFDAKLNRRITHRYVLDILPEVN